MMKNIKFIIGILLVICLTIVHIHFSLNTADNSLNPVTLMALLTRDDDVAYFMTGYCVQFLVTLFAAYFILMFRHKFIWLIVFIVGAIAAYWINSNFPFLHLSIFQNSKVEEYYYDFYGYSGALILSVYYVFLQLFVLFLYMLLAYVLEKPFIKEMRLRLSNSMISEKVRRNKYAIGVAVLSIFLLYMMIQIFVRHKYLIG